MLIYKEQHLRGKAAVFSISKNFYGTSTTGRRWRSSTARCPSVTPEGGRCEKGQHKMERSIVKADKEALESQTILRYFEAGGARRSLQSRSDETKLVPWEDLSSKTQFFTRWRKRCVKGGNHIAG